MPSTINATPTSSGLVQSADASGVLALQTGGTTAVTIDGSQNVGIGISSPVGKLDVAGSTSRVRWDLNNSYTYQGATNVAGSSYANAVYDGLSHQWQVSSTERMRIDSSGNLLVGTTSSSVYSQNTVNGIVITPGTSSNIQIATDPAGSTGNACVLLNMRNTPINGAKYIRFFYNGTSDIGNITLNGTTAVAYNTSSDYRLKENIAPMTGALSLVQQLKPVTYNWKVDGSDGQGFIAHELQAVIPDCVTGEKDAVDEDGKPVHQGIDTSFLVATLTAAIQEQQALITQLQADVAALKVQP